MVKHLTSSRLSPLTILADDNTLFKPIAAKDDNDRWDSSKTIRSESTPSPTLHRPHSTPRAMTPRAITPRTLSPSLDVPTKDKGKDKDKEREPDSKESNNDKERGTPASPTSPRVKGKSKRENKDEDIVKLTRMTADEKEMIRSLAKLTRKKNKMLDQMDESHRKEKEALILQFELEKKELSKQILSLQSQVTFKNHEVFSEHNKNQELRDKLQQATLELQATQASLVNLKQVLKKFKKQCDSELNKKAQSMMEMTLQLGKLHKLRDSMDCVVCEERVAKVILEPCCHMVMCSVCSHSVRKCPMCRADISSRLEVFYNWIV